MNTSQRKNIPTPFFNVHTEAMGNLCKLEIRKGNKGDFAVVTFRMQEGHRENLEFTFVTLTASVSEDEQLLTSIADSINSKTPVFAALRLASFKGTPFVFPETSPNKGQLGINYSAKLIKIIYLKVGDRIIKQSEATSIHPVSVTNQVKKDAGARKSANEQLKPLCVTLTKSDANFDATKQRLIQDGYRWHADKKQWMLKSVSDLLIPKDELIASGYIFNNGVWEGQFPNTKQYSKQNNQ